MPVKRQRPSSSDVPKRTRFASPSTSGPGGAGGRSQSSASVEPEDDLLQADLPEGAQAAKQRERRQLRGAEGYDSDSSNDEDGVVYSRRKDKQEDEGEDDVDMFGDDLPSDKGKGKGKDKEGKGKGKGKDKEFMDLGDIEGQEFTRSGSDDGRGDVDDDNMAGSGSDDEESRVARRKQGLDGDMGYQLTGFNMKEEMDEGKFTADGESYVVNDKDQGEKHDQWLTEVDDQVIIKARQAHKEREKRERELQERESGAEGAKRRREEEARLLREAMGWMERGETVLEALQRLGKEVEEKKKRDEMEELAIKGKKKSWAERQKERKAALAAAAAEQGSTPSNPFTALSDIVSTLSTAGQLDVYSLSRESIQRMLPVSSEPHNGSGNSSNGNGNAPAPSPRPASTPTDTRAFQYRFSIPYVRTLPEHQRPVEREIFGPFPVSQLSQWRNTGFFGGPACENVELRLAGPEPGSWGSWEGVVGR